MKLDKKIIWYLYGDRVGPRAGAEAGAEREARSGGRSGGPRAQPVSIGVSTFFFEFHEYHPWYQVFCAKIFVNTAKNFKKINDIQVTK